MARCVSSGRLRFQRAGQSTAVLAAYADTPLRILTPKNHGDAAWAYTSTLGGGLVGGDRLRLEIELDMGARAFVSTQGPTRIYRSDTECESAVSARVGPGAALFLLPDPVACFAGAAYRQETQIELAEHASLACWDLLTAGRTAYGERWAFRRYWSSLQIRRGGRALIDDALLLDPRHGALARRLGQFDALATLLIAGPLFVAARQQILEQIDSAPLQPGAPILSAASPLGADALLVRFAARTTQHHHGLAHSIGNLLSTLHNHLADIPKLLGDNPWSRRN